MDTAGAGHILPFPDRERRRVSRGAQDRAQRLVALIEALAQQNPEALAILEEWARHFLEDPE